ncbi:putative P-loop containing nucleoside triphosphate hydrolase, leucine-rich repeat domain, L [Medicago truncatula]|uniref:Putative P-loop containing nucleoside triphosphate hydrolase, leucine-rich repeat domain, L n=1 Tax=Medicago truncatula TaxID=3880 RepID=A0A396IR92_MEDTR|nr:putative P-loop containing nucleoside triphosphate hydrolase, leucine-rich repeat domain, L [Medicago truncatula]
MLLKLHKQKGDKPPEDTSQMNRELLTNEVRNYLQQKRYVVVFDDVWTVHFWDDFKFAAIDSKNGSRIFITTRNKNVVNSCKKSSFTEMFELQCLTQEQSLELFNKKAFKFDYGGCYPNELIGIANEIVKKWNGLPLAIAAIGGLLSTREKNLSEWQRFRENLNLELKTDTDLIGIKEVLSLSYDDLPCYLKSCLFYFGVYPEDYEVKSKRVIRQWIAEGFVKEERGKTLEEVAEGYLTELIHRSLVQVSSLRIDGKAKGCRVHDLICNMILEKHEDFNFCKHSSDDGQRSSSEIVRRLSITTIDDAFWECIHGSHVRSLFCFGNQEKSSSYFKGNSTKYKLLKVLDFEDFDLKNIPNNLGIFIHLKYLSYNNSNSGAEVPKSIGMLQNLETLVIRGIYYCELPKEISKLIKLRHLIGKTMSLIQLKNGIGEMKSLQTLRRVSLNMDGAAEVIKALGKLKLIRNLGLLDVHKQNESILSSSINEMQHLEILYIRSCFNDNESIDLNLISPPPMLQNLILQGKFKEFPEWTLDLQNLTMLRLVWPCSDKDPLQSLKSLQHLLSLYLDLYRYEGLQLHFQDGGFQKLEVSTVIRLSRVREIIIDKGSMPSLKTLRLMYLRNLKNIPTGIQHLEKLEYVYIWGVVDEFGERSSTEDWNWIMEHVPLVKILPQDYEEIKYLRS